MFKKFRIKIDDDTTKIFKILKEKSKAYIVGGYIRDKLLELQPKDCDFSTNLSLLEILDLFSDKKLFSTRVVSEKLNIVEIKFNNKKFEIARLREDLEYYGKRKDFSFNFIDNIEMDLLRRDFTINSLAYDGENLIFADPKSLIDINERKIRFMGEAKKRILEDPFRMLRMFRFFSEKSLLKIDEQALEATKNSKDMIWNLSTEMLREEFIKIVKGRNYLMTFKYINDIDFFNQKFYLSSYQEKYENRIKELFKNSNFKLLEELNFSKKTIEKIKNYN
ncbi:MAG: hypothetical protein Q4A58_05115 [Fusobacterium sp.]|uniref:hypothetical protein n=1 Tax=Fusobacterium sp. TaxID=68766 RepID=UPI0026DACBAE|nr:hypothetical protein [Fusobacterium sp.]MDO4690658.1 hypothetical protein [Fusobacterium sp.]